MPELEEVGMERGVPLSGNGSIGSLELIMATLSYLSLSFFFFLSRTKKKKRLLKIKPKTFSSDEFSQKPIIPHGSSKIREK